MCHYIVEIIRGKLKSKIALPRIPVIGDGIKLPGVEYPCYVTAVTLYPIHFNNQFTGGKLQEQAVSALVFC
jgi:hypothetical protein